MKRTSADGIISTTFVIPFFFPSQWRYRNTDLNMVKIINKGFSYLPYSRLNSEPDDQEHPASNPCEKLIHPPEKFLQQINIFFKKHSSA